MYGYLRDAYAGRGACSRVSMFRFEQLMLRMANQGEWRPVLEFLSSAIARHTGIRRLHRRAKRCIQGFLAAYLSVADYYVFRSEAELGKGHADISAGAAGCPLPAPASRLPDRIEVPEALGSACSVPRRSTRPGFDHGGEHRRTAQLARYLAGRAAWRGSFPACASSGADRRLPRLGAGVPARLSVRSPADRTRRVERASCRQIPTDVRRARAARSAC